MSKRKRRGADENAAHELRRSIENGGAQLSKGVKVKIFRLLRYVAWVVIISFVSFVIYTFLLIRSQTKWVFDPDEYGDVLDDHAYAGKPLLAHFPKTIPPQSQEVSFYYLPGFLQGGMILRLRLRLPEKKVQEILSYWEKRKDTLSPPPKEPEPPEVLFPPKTEIIPKTRHGRFEDFRPIPKHFQTFVIGGDHGDTQGAPWNHGRLYGVSISEKENRVVYWADSW